MSSYEWFNPLRVVAWQYGLYVDCRSTKLFLFFELSLNGTLTYLSAYFLLLCQYLMVLQFSLKKKEKG